MWFSIWSVLAALAVLGALKLFLGATWKKAIGFAIVTFLGLSVLIWFMDRGTAQAAEPPAIQSMDPNQVTQLLAEPLALMIYMESKLGITPSCSDMTAVCLKARREAVQTAFEAAPQSTQTGVQPQMTRYDTAITTVATHTNWATSAWTCVAEGKSVTGFNISNQLQTVTFPNGMFVTNVATGKVVNVFACTGTVCHPNTNSDAKCHPTDGGDGNTPATPQTGGSSGSTDTHVGVDVNVHVDVQATLVAYAYAQAIAIATAGSSSSSSGVYRTMPVTDTPYPTPVASLTPGPSPTAGPSPTPKPPLVCDRHLAPGETAWIGPDEVVKGDVEVWDGANWVPFYDHDCGGLEQQTGLVMRFSTRMQIRAPWGANITCVADRDEFSFKSELLLSGCGGHCDTVTIVYMPSGSPQTCSTSRPTSTPGYAPAPSPTIVVDPCEAFGLCTPTPSPGGVCHDFTLAPGETKIVPDFGTLFSVKGDVLINGGRLFDNNPKTGFVLTHLPAGASVYAQWGANLTDCRTQASLIDEMLHNPGNCSGGCDSVQVCALGGSCVWYP